MLLIRESTDTKFYSSIANINDIYSSGLNVPLLVPTIKIEKIDFNNDENWDQFNINLMFPASISDVKDIRLLLLFDYSFDSDVKLITKTAALVHFSSNRGFSYIKAVGELKLKQFYPINQIADRNFLKYHDFFSDVTETYDFNTVYSFFNNQNVTTFFDYDVSYQPYKNSEYVELEMSIKIPIFQEVQYIASTMHTLKSTWVKYLATLIPTVIIFYVALVYAYRLQLVAAVVKRD